MEQLPQDVSDNGLVSFIGFAGVVVDFAFLLLVLLDLRIDASSLV